MPASDSSAAKSKKKGGGFLSRQVAKTKNKDALTEEQLSKKDTITVEDVLNLEKATESKKLEYFLLLFVLNIFKIARYCIYIYIYI